MMTPSSSERDAARTVLTRPLAAPFGRAFQNLLCVTLGSIRNLNATRSECTALAAETQGLGAGAARQAGARLRHPCVPCWGDVRKSIPSLGLKELEYDPEAKSRTLYGRIYLEICTEIQRAQ